MRKFPKNLKTKADIYNCLEMVRAGELRASDLIKAINKIKAQNYMSVPITELSQDRKTVTTNYFPEATPGAAAKGGEVACTIKTVTHNESEPDEQGNVTFISTDITISKAATKDADTFHVEKDPSIYEKYDVTEAELDAILAELEE